MLSISPASGSTVVQIQEGQGSSQLGHTDTPKHTLSKYYFKKKQTFFDSSSENVNYS